MEYFYKPFELNSLDCSVIYSKTFVSVINNTLTVVYSGSCIKLKVTTYARAKRTQIRLAIGLLHEGQSFMPCFS